MRILVAGDFVPQYRVLKLLELEQYEKIFGEIRPIVQNADFSLVNLECPLAPASSSPILKSGPNLKCETVHMLDSVQWTGFKGVTLANNHFRDYGEEGVRTTLSSCHDRGLYTVGGGLNIEEATKTLYVQENEKKIAIINACEEEFSIATSKAGGSNPLDIIYIYQAIKDAKRQADYCIVIVHGGVEQYQLPTPRMQQVYRFFVEAGADVVINHHQHSLSGYEIYNGSPIFYGLGNFCFDSINKINSWYQGYLVELNLNSRQLNFKLIPYKQCTKESPSVQLLIGEDLMGFERLLASLNNIILRPESVSLSFEQYLSQKRKRLLWDLEPFKNRYLRFLQKHHLLPRLIKGCALTDTYNFMSCASHREVMCELLKKEIYE